MARILVVPGLHGSPADHWQSRLEQARPDAVRVNQADWDRPDRDTWLVRLVAAVQSHPDAVLVGHSLGCALIAHLARAWPNAPVAAALLVAPADVESRASILPLFRSFIPLPFAPMPFPTVVVASRNDPYVPFTRARGFATAWGADFVDAGASGHINVDAGFGCWPAGERLVADLVAAAARRSTRMRRSSRIEHASSRIARPTSPLQETSPAVEP